MKRSYVVGIHLERLNINYPPTNRNVLQHYFYFLKDLKLDSDLARTTTSQNVLKVFRHHSRSPPLLSSIKRSLKRLIDTYAKKVRSNNFKFKNHSKNQTPPRPRPAVAEFRRFAGQLFMKFGGTGPAVPGEEAGPDDEGASSSNDEPMSEAEPDSEATEDESTESESDDEDQRSSNDPDYKCYIKVRSKKIKVCDSAMMETIDRAGASSRQAMMIMSQTLKSSGQNVSECVLSTDTISRNRKKNREETYEQLKSERVFPENLVLHFDGVRIKDNNTQKFVEHLVS